MAFGGRWVGMLVAFLLLQLRQPRGAATRRAAARAAGRGARARRGGGGGGARARAHTHTHPIARRQGPAPCCGDPIHETDRKILKRAQQGYQNPLGIPLCAGRND
jgi:hypothetical protein